MVRTIARECFTLGTYIRWHLLVLATRLRQQEAEDRVRCRGLAVIWETEVARSNGFEKYRSVTLRVSSPVMDVARDAASEEGISLNSLANRQLRQYAEWDRLKHKLGYVTVRDRVFQHILEKLPDDEIIELGRRLASAQVDTRYRISTPADAANLVMLDMAYLDSEQMRILLLDSKSQLVEKVNLYQGTANSSVLRAAEIFRPAIIRNCPGLILCHNHPSGDPTPSPEDIEATKHLVAAGRILDIELVDHIIIGHQRFVSLKEHLRWQ